MKVTVGDREVVVKELSIGEIRGWLSSVTTNPTQNVDLIGEILLEGMTLREISVFTDMTDDQINATKPSALVQLVNAIKKTNPQWIECRRRILEMGEKAIAAGVNKG